MTSLEGRRILVAEDEYFLANELERELTALGATVLGPVASVAEALQLANAEHFDIALLDINLRGEMAEPVALVLQAKGVPFIMATGYDDRFASASFDSVPLLSKPLDLRELISTMVRCWSPPTTSTAAMHRLITGIQ